MNDYLKMVIEALRRKQATEQVPPQPGAVPVPAPVVTPPVMGGKNPANRRALEEM